MAKLPEWVLKHQKKGTQAVQIGNGYYLYKISSRWNPKKKRPDKITDKYLGTITREGVVKPKHERVLEDLENITVKEYGATFFLMENNKEIIDAVKRVYPREWKEIVSFAMFRFMYNSPIKNLLFYYTTSYLSNTIKDALLSPKPVAKMLHDIGLKRGKTTKLLRSFVEGNEFMVIDGTHIVSSSEGVDSAAPGYNSKRVFDPQVRLIMIHSLDNHMPAYFRLLTGSITDISAVSLTVKEAGIKNAILVGDKGFYSKDNVKELKKQGVKYVLPLKRDSTLIDHTPFKSGDKRNLHGYFLFRKRSIWYHEHKHKRKRIITFLDDKLKAAEEHSFIHLVEHEKRTMEGFYEKQYAMGTISVITDHKGTPEDIYNLLKGRLEIEAVIDVFKNILKADRTYMRTDEAMEGWMLVNFISLLFYYKTYRMLAEKKMLRKYSPNDVLMHLSRIYKMKINRRWATSEIPKKSRDIIEKLGIPIT
ncbi:MAG: hypothetical protein A7315_09005 [Candidatus Altiarchaeales archaeon WOR_SM1_79]|nr:MAG: hypothetical protein A7315_09005 [Candidatus Altiarchaeales archaeon WOR_SM1_79]